jgi:hypothetical protein
MNWQAHFNRIVNNILIEQLRKGKTPMKLSDLRVAIRALKGNPTINVIINGSKVNIPLQKTAFLTAVGDAFASDPAGRAVETEITITEDGVLGGLLSEAGSFTDWQEEPEEDEDELEI